MFQILIFSSENQSKLIQLFIGGGDLKTYKSNIKQIIKIKLVRHLRDISQWFMILFYNL